MTGPTADLTDVLSEFARTMVTDFPVQSILDRLVTRIVDVRLCVCVWPCQMRYQWKASYYRVNDLGGWLGGFDG